MIDDRTEYLNLPLPHPDNFLEVDVQRLRDALEGFDEYCEQLTDEASSAQQTADQALGIANAAVPAAEKGVPNGVAPLDAQGRVPIEHTPEALIGSVRYMGGWDASANVPPIPAATPENMGHYYLVTAGGSTEIDGESSWSQGDWIISNGVTWDKISNSEVFDASAIQSGVFSVDRIPVLSLDKIPVLSAEKVPSIPTSRVAGLDASLASLMPKAGGTFTGNLTIQNTAGYITFNDTNWGVRHIHCNDGNIGFLNNGGGWACYSDNAGNFVATGNVGAYSDRKHKRAIRTLDDALTSVEALRGVSYVDRRTGRRRLGVVAQEVREVLPEVVFETKDGLAVDYGNLVAPLIEAIKSLSARVRELEARG